MNDNLPGESDHRLFELLARESGEAGVERAPSRLKARLYTALVQKQQESGRLRTLAETRSCGHGLCIFEDLWERVTRAKGAQSLNCCSACHARLLAEHLERPPIYWGHCPYVAFAEEMRVLSEIEINAKQTLKVLRYTVFRRGKLISEGVPCNRLPKAVPKIPGTS